MSRDRKNILFLPKWYPNKDNLYHGIFVHRHAICAAKENNISVVFAKAADQKKLINYEFAVEDQIKIHRFYYKKRITGIPFLDSIIKLYLYFRCCYKGWKIVNTQNVKIDILHVHVLGRTSIFALFLNFINNIPIVITEHWSGYFKERNEYKGVFRKGFDKKICSISKSIITVSNAQSVAMQAHGLSGTYETIPNVVVNNYFENTLDNQPKNQLLVVADQDNNVKNIKGIINSFKLLIEEYPEVNLSIIGGGIDLEINLQYVKHNALEESICLHGEQDVNFIKKELAKTYALVLFSNFENSPCVIGEAFATGTPVIATKVGGVTELVDDKKGILVEPNNEKQLLEAFRDIISSSKYDAKYLKEFAFDTFSEEKIGKRLTKIYNSI